MQINYIVFKDLKIEHICKQSLKHSYISVSGLKIVLKTPKVSKSYIDKLLLNKENWIRKQLLKKKESLKLKLGDEVLVFAEIMKVDEVMILKSYIDKLKVVNDKNLLKSYDRFYKTYACEYLPSRLKYFSDKMGLEYSEIKFRKMKSMWGSCNSKGVITLNSELMKVKKELIDYVLVHELAHLKHMNHSKDFHKLVERYLVNSYSLRKELKMVTLN